MKHELKMKNLYLYFDNIKNKITNNPITFEIFKSYYMILKEAVFSGLFDLNYLKEMANLLLKANVIIKLDETDILKKYNDDLIKLINFISKKNQKTEAFEGFIIKKKIK